MTVRSPSPVTPGSLEAVLHNAWDAGEFTTAEAMADSGLTRSTTIDALDRLIALQLLRELPNAREAGKYRKGRPSRRFELRSDAAVVAGVDAGRSHLTAVVADLRGAVLAHESVPGTSSPDDPDERRRTIEGALAAALGAAGARREDVLSLCLGVPAAVDSHGASPPHREGFWQTMNPGLRELFSEWVPIVRVENDASLAALAEGAVGAAAGSRDFVALLAGDRLGVGVVLDGRLLRGARGAAGEPIGLRWVAGVESDRGLGTVIANWARTDIEAGVVRPGHPLAGAGEPGPTARVVLELAATGDGWASTLVERAAEVLARIGVVLASMYDPAQIVVCGAVADGLGPAVEMANQRLPGHLHGPPPVIRTSPLGADVVVTGAVMGAVEAARDGALGLALRRTPGTVPARQPARQTTTHGGDATPAVRRSPVPDPAR